MRTSNIFVLKLAPFLAVLGLAFAAPPAMAALALYECTSCTTVAAFQSYAQTAYSSNGWEAEHMNIGFDIFNSSAALAASIHVRAICLSTADGVPCSWDYMWVDSTGSTTDLQQFFEEMAPSLAIQVPSSVATTFTGTSQASAVSAWLDQATAGAIATLGADMLTVFPDGSSAEYQVTGTNPMTLSFVSDTGHAANGQPENDSGQLISVSQYTQLTPSLQFNIGSRFQLNNTQEAAIDKAEIGSPSLNNSGTVPMQTVLSFDTSKQEVVSLWTMST